MALIIYGKSAEWFWQSTHSAYLSHDMLCYINPKEAERVLRESEIPQAADFESQCALSPLLQELPRPIHFLVDSPKKRLRHDGVKAHCTIDQLPPGSLVKLEENVYIASPELSFVTAAREMVFGCLVKYGYALCGTFRLVPVTNKSVNDCGALCSAEGLMEYLAFSGRERGIALARRAAAHVVDGSASPRESFLSMVLSLPCRYGGYGLPKPYLNYVIPIKDELRDAVSKTYVVSDLCWFEQKVSLEYDSNERHLDEYQRADDSEKAIVLSRMGFQTQSITKAQVESVERLDRIAWYVFDKLNLRIRDSVGQTRDKRIRLMEECLKTELPRM